MSGDLLSVIIPPPADVRGMMTAMGSFLLIGILLEGLKRSLGIERCLFHGSERRGNFRRGDGTMGVTKTSLDQLRIRTDHGNRVPQIVKRRSLFFIGQGGRGLGFVVGWRHEHFPA